ncbi:MAG TPA: hypothetical protein EYG26_10380 [Planctomycetes bacterium]|nr:hypothetical protein [Planctomycetota bacterium]
MRLPILVSLAFTTLPLIAAPTQDHPVTPENFEPIQLGDKEGHEHAAAFFEGVIFDPAIPDGSEVLGQSVGSRIARPREILSAFSMWASLSDRMTLHDYGKTHEGRRLIYAVITSPANHARLESIRSSIDLLSDPRGLSEEQAKDLTERTPAIAWMGYSIHGDETSGSDAALAVAHRLVAGQDEGTLALLDSVVVVLDPCMNPDGRARIASLVQQAAGRRVNLDSQAMQRGRWPFGRGNHYLFDMNRDWMAGVCPETRGRWRVNLALRPQLFVDAHEMSGLDTFLMYPQAAPRHPALPARLLHWQGVFADAHGEVFDAMGWGYYTREWADAWYPGYSDAWGSLGGAIGMLYEQGRNAGQPLRRDSGEVVPYREAVHGQVIASWSNLETLAQNRAAVLGDYHAFHRSHVDGSRSGSKRMFFYHDPSGNLTRVLIDQGVEVFAAAVEFEAQDVTSHLGAALPVRTFPAGTLLVPVTQPRGALVRAYLEFDPRIDSKTLLDERERLERGDGSRLYDVTAWDLGRQMGVNCWWGTPEGLTLGDPLGGGKPASPVPAFSGDAYAYALSADDPRALAFLARAFEAGIQVHLSDEEFVGRSAGTSRVFPRGSFLIRRHENQSDLGQRIVLAAVQSGARPMPLSGGRSPDLDHPDLGGQHFTLLYAPRVALVAGEGVQTSGLGHIWQYLDEVLGASVTLIDSASLGSTDLREYQVLILPPGNANSWFDRAGKSIDAWVRGGGTLIAVGNSASAVVTQEEPMVSARRRRDVLEELDRYALATRRARAAREVELDAGALWEGPEDPAPKEMEDSSPEGSSESIDSDPSRQDAWQRRFMPQGVVLKGEIDDHHWLTGGCPAEFALFFAGSSVLLDAGRVPVRFATSRALRLGGLLWPEARARIADSAWVTQESHGSGQVILFATSPVFRGSWAQTGRILGNAVLLGPGVGASPVQRR